MIPIIKPFLPPLEDYKKYLDDIWNSKWLTNMGPLAENLEKELEDYLKVENLLFVTSGTVALQMAIKALDLKGEIITTPYSFVATTSSIAWVGCKPVFVDIDKETLNIDPKQIESAITPHTTGILATHIYGNPCDVLAIEKIAKKHNLKVIYDGAHAFGVEVNGTSIFEYGDISICSLHATKYYHSVEGGLVITKDKALLKKLTYIRNFGFNGNDAFDGLGINGKNSELHAAMGLVNLKWISKIFEKRKLLTETYNKELQYFNAAKPTWKINATLNYAFYPLIFDTDELMHKCILKLEENKIHTRRYFYPSLASSMPYLEVQRLKVTDCIIKRIVCLPLYFDLSVEDIGLISGLLLEVQNSQTGMSRV